MNAGPNHQPNTSDETATQVVQASTAFVFDEPGVPASVATQLRHGDAVTVGESQRVGDDVWLPIQGGAVGVDVGWVRADMLIESSRAYGGNLDADNATPLVVSSLVGQLFAVASRKAGPCVAELPGEATVLGVERITGDAQSPLDHNPWWRVVLADGTEGWLQGGDVTEGALPALRDGVARVREALRYLGRPYVWGGACSFGLDCSGLTALLARRGDPKAVLPHSAKRQLTDDWSGLQRVGDDRAIKQLAEAQRGDESKPGSVGWQHADESRERWGDRLQPGDFVYFAMSAGHDDATKRRIDHVGVFARGTDGTGNPGGADLIHASSSGTPCTKREPLWGPAFDDVDRRSALAMRLLGVRRLA